MAGSQGIRAGKAFVQVGVDDSALAAGLRRAGALEKTGVINLDSGKRRDELAKKNAAIDVGVAKDNKLLDQGAATTAVEADSANRTAIADAGKELADAVAQLNALRNQAATGAAPQGPYVDPKGGFVSPFKPTGSRPDALTPEGLDQSIQRAKSTAEIKGGFNVSRGALNIGDSVSDAVKEGVKETKKTNDKLQEIKREIANTGRLS